MRYLNLICLMIVACSNGQDETLYINWLSNPAIDSVLYYELYIIENVDSVQLANLNWENTQFDSVYHSPFKATEYFVNMEDTLNGSFMVYADGAYVTAYMIAVNRYGRSLFSNQSNILRKYRELPPGQSRILFIGR